MKILWLSNTEISGLDPRSTGTWLGAMAQKLLSSGQVVLGNITKGPVREPKSQNCPQLQQWLVPSAPAGKCGLPSRKAVEDVLRLISIFSPDLIHIWGVEEWWGLLQSRGLLTQPVLLEMQGLKGVYSRVFHGGLTGAEQRSCRGPKERFLGRSIEKDRRKFAEWGSFEREIIAGCGHIAVQTPWVEAWVKAVNPACHTYQTELMLRQEFYDEPVWSPPLGDPRLFCSAAYPAPLKGLHDAIRATALLKRRFPKIRLRIAGAHQKEGIRQDGYVRWLNRLLTSIGVSDCIQWLGPLSGKGIVREHKSCSVYVMTSHVENCCTAMQEALYLGVPTVSAYAGGVPSLAKEEEAALYFPPGDEAMLANQTTRLLTDQALALQLSRNARSVAMERNNPEKIVSNQIDIYHKVLAGKKGWL